MKKNSDNKTGNENNRINRRKVIIKPADIKAQLRQSQKAYLQTY